MIDVNIDSPILSDADFAEMVVFATKLAERREQLALHQRRCPICLSRQLQLLAYVEKEVDWKCRMCNHTFTTIEEWTS